MSIPRVLGIAGSLRSDSYNRRLLEAATEELPDADWSVARLRGIPASIVMPRTASPVKRRAVEEYGGRVIVCEPTLEAREATAAQVLGETGGTLVPPYDHADVIAGADAIVIATPEYNHSISGVLKNAIDWASRPAGRSPLRDKPVLMMGVSTGSGGARRALDVLRQVLESIDARPLDRVVSVASARGRFADGQPDSELRRELRDALDRLPVRAGVAAR